MEYTAPMPGSAASAARTSSPVARVDAVALADLDHAQVAVALAQRAAKADFPLLLAVKAVAAQRDQHPQRPRFAPTHRPIRYAAVSPAARLSMPT